MSLVNLGRRRRAVRLTLAVFLFSNSVLGQLETSRAGSNARTEQENPSTHAQEDASPAGVAPPRLMEFMEAQYPQQAIAHGVEGSVILRLRISADGSVSEIELVTPLGYGLDEAARQAALKFRFDPARRDGRPVASTILYSYEFRLPLRAADELVPADDDPGSTTTPNGTAEVQADDGDAQPVKVTVEGRSTGERLRRSANAVHVVDTEEARRQTADMGEVLARSQGISVQRTGGLGSGTRFSLNGLGDDQVRFFIDGIPLDLAGYPFGVANVPVNFANRIEVYRGVVPVAFGADALGGAVNLVTDEEIEGTHGSASYQTGSFGTHRVTLGIRTHDPVVGSFTRATAFLDRAENDYPIFVDAPDERGRPVSTRIYRFHDAYRATGVNVETGIVERPWAKRLLVRAFLTEYRKELQHNVVMSLPYGDAEHGGLTAGVSGRYTNVFLHRHQINLTAGHTYGKTAFRDLGECVYDWFGQCVTERRQPGELTSGGRDQVVVNHTTFARANLGTLLLPSHGLRLSLSPTYTVRQGEERTIVEPDAVDPLSAERKLLTFVGGLEYELDLLDERLENIAFVKQYFQLVRSEEPLAGGAFQERDRDTHRFGMGDGLRYAFLDWLYSKVSYEYATRLPRPEEVFGDAVRVVDNLELEPEVSHNANLEVTVDMRDLPVGALRGSVNGFVREVDQLIVLLGDENVYTYENVYSARSVGFEASAGWTSPGEYVVVDGNVTHMEFRNTSQDGAFAGFAGDRIPNRPYLFANASLRLQKKAVAVGEDRLSLAWHTRYVHEFFRYWESNGLRRFKDTVDAQLLHSVGLTYLVEGERANLSTTLEVQNLTDRPAFDFFGVQRPGRAAYLKMVAEF